MKRYLCCVLLLTAVGVQATEFPGAENLEAAEGAAKLDMPDDWPQGVQKELKAIQKIDFDLQEKVDKINKQVDKRIHAIDKWAAQFNADIKQMEWAAKKAAKQKQPLESYRKKSIDNAETTAERQRDRHIKRAIMFLKRGIEKEGTNDLKAAIWKSKINELTESLSWDGQAGREYSVPRWRFVKIPLPKGTTYKVRINKEDRWAGRREQPNYLEGRLGYYITTDSNWGYYKCVLDKKNQAQKDLTLITDDFEVTGTENELQFLFITLASNSHPINYKTNSCSESSVRIKVEIIK